MKRFFSIFMCVLVMAAMLVVVSNAAQPVIFTFDSKNACNAFISGTNGMNGSFDEELGYYKLVNTNHDPSISHSFKTSGFNTADLPFVRYSFRIISGLKSEMPKGQFFFATNNGIGMGNPGTYTMFPLESTTDWQQVIVDMRTINGSAWNGNILTFRLDPVQAAEGDFYTILIDSVGFFATEEEAKGQKLPENTFANVPVIPETTVTPEVVAPAPETTPVEGDSEPLIFTFDNKDTWTSFARAITNMEAEFDTEYGYVKIKNKNHDPNFAHPFKDNAFEAAKYPVVRYRFKIIEGLSDAMPVGQFFFTNDAGAKMGEAGTFTNFKIKSTSDWQDVVVDMTKINASAWKGKITSFRIDPVQASDGAVYTILVESIGFFPDMKSATEDGSSDFLYINGNQTITIPRGSMKPGETKDDFVIKDETVDTAGKLPGYEPVIIFKDADGNESVVALSYTNGKRFNYVARKAGEYRAAYVTKEYDDTDGHWGLNYIRFVSARKLFGGTSPTEFSPDMTMTRGMFVTVLGRMHGVDTAVYAGATPFADVNASEYYAPYINWVTEMKIASPAASGGFEPESPITRADMAKILNDYVAAYGYSLNEVSEGSAFTDISALGADIQNAIGAMQSAGIINGKGEGRFDPDGISTRAEVATVMARIIKSVLGLPLTFGEEKSSVILSFSDEKTVKQFSVAGDGDISGGNEGATFTGHTHQFYVTYHPDIDMYLEDYPYFKMCYRINSSPSQKAQFYYYTDKTAAAGVDHPYVQFNLKGNIGEWNTMEFDFSTAEAIKQSFSSSSKTPWTGKLTKFAIYPLRMTSGEPATTRDITIKYMAFFSTEEEMKAFDESKITSSGISEVKKEELVVSENLGKERIHLGAFFPFHATLATEESIKELAEAGIDISLAQYGGLSLFIKQHVLDWHAKYGIMAWLIDPALNVGTHKSYSEKGKDQIMNSYGTHPAFYGNVFSDEPGVSHYAGIAEYVAQYNKDFPDKVPFVNLLPMYASNDQFNYGAAAQKIDFYDTPASSYEEYLNRYTETVDTPYICTDIYPLRKDASNNKVTYKDYVKSIELTAKEARETGKDFWCYIQSFGSKTRPFRNPDEADLRWQMYSMLSFGAKTIFYYVWHGPAENDYINTPIDADGNKNPLWESAKKLNGEIIALSDVYLAYDNIGAFTVNTENTPYAQMMYPLEGFAPIAEVKCDDALLIGCFNKKDASGNAFTVVNMSELALNKTVSAAFKLNAQKVTAYFGGNPTVLTADADGYYNISLNCGEGVFVTVE